MYRWLWTHLPGPAGARLLTLLLLGAAVVALLMTVVFPWVASWLPFEQVDVDALGPLLPIGAESSPDAPVSCYSY